MSGTERTLYCSGQTSVDSEGAPVHAGDFRAQMNTVFDNLEDTLKAADMSLANVVRTTVYTTDMDALLQNYDILRDRFGKAGVTPANTVLEVARLAFPELLFEIQATAVA